MVDYIRGADPRRAHRPDAAAAAAVLPAEPVPLGNSIRITTPCFHWTPLCGILSPPVMIIVIILVMTTVVILLRVPPRSGPGRSSSRTCAPWSSESPSPRGPKP